MNPDDELNLIIKSAEKQINLTHRVINEHLDESERIHARTTSEALSAVAVKLLLDPTTGTTP